MQRGIQVVKARNEKFEGKTPLAQLDADAIELNDADLARVQGAYGPYYHHPYYRHPYYRHPYHHYYHHRYYRR